MKQQDMSKLVKKAIRGDSLAFAELYNYFGKKAYYIGLRLNKNEHDANDVVQETMLKLYNNLSNIRDIGSISSFVSKTAYNCSIDIIRQNNKEFASEPETINTVIEDDFLNEEFVPEEYLESAEKQKYIISVIDELSDEQRSVVLMYYFDDFSVKEISEMLKTTETVVKSRMYRARSILKEKLNYKLIKEVFAVAIGLPALSKILITDAQAAFTVTARLENWSIISQAIGYSPQAISAASTIVNAGTTPSLATAGGIAGTTAAVGAGGAIVGKVVIGAVALITAGAVSFQGYNMIKASTESVKPDSFTISPTPNVIDDNKVQPLPDSPHEGNLEPYFGESPEQSTTSQSVDGEVEQNVVGKDEQALTTDGISYDIIEKKQDVLRYPKGTAKSIEQILQDAGVKLLTTQNVELEVDFYDQIDFAKAGDYPVVVLAKQGDIILSQVAIIVIIE